MTDRARELREALETVRDGSGTTKLWPARQVVENAARTIALPILEQDSELVGRIEGALRTMIYSEQTIASLRIRVLAALIPTDKNPPPKITDYDYETEGLGGT